LGFNSVDYGKIEAAKEAKEGARPIMRHPRFDDDESNLVRRGRAAPQ